MSIIIDLGDWPSWLSAIAALIAVIFGVVPAFNAFKKLISKTNEHEEQLEQLTKLATSNKEQTDELSKLAEESVKQTAELKRLISLNDIALKADKKPNIKLDIESNLNPDGKTGQFMLTVTNTNTQSTITDIEISETHKDDEVQHYVITKTEFGQTKKFEVFKKGFNSLMVIDLYYKTEQGFEYIQDITLQVWEGKVNIVKQGPVISKENAAL